MIIFFEVGATPEVIRRRVEARAQKEGRDVPEDTLKYSIENAPKSFAVLKHLADFAIAVANNSDEADPKVTSMSRHGQEIPFDRRGAVQSCPKMIFFI